MTEEPTSQTKPKDVSIKPATAPAPTIDFVDLPELAETFADSIQSISFDGQSLRLNFCITRLGEIRQGERPTGKRYPCCRIVLSSGAAIELIYRLNQVSAALTKAGILKPAPTGPALEKPN